MQQNIQLAPVYEKCPRHVTNDIVLFCLQDNCREPLCKECCKLHITMHNQQGTQAEIDTVDNVRLCLFNDIHNLKVRFEEERAILHHFSDGEHSTLLKTIHQKLEQVKKTLLQLVNDYCVSLEKEVQNRIAQHRAAHPGEKKELHKKLNTAISQLDAQEKALQSQKYIKACLVGITEEKDHDLEGLSNEIDNALKHYLENLFEVHIHQDKIDKITNALNEYVEIHQANLGEELDEYTQQIREGKKVQGIQQLRPPQLQQQQYQQKKQQQQQYEVQPPLSQTMNQNNKIQQSIYDQPVQQYITNTAPPLQYSRLGVTSKNYESRLQSNNEKLKQYYG